MTVNLADLLKGLQNDFGEEIEKAATASGGPSGAYDIELPLDREYRVVVADSKYALAKSSGREQIVITYEVIEPSEFAGAKFQEYMSLQPNNEAASRTLAQTLGALSGADITALESNNKDAFAESLSGSQAV